MDGQKYSVAEYENKKTCEKPSNIATYISPRFEPKGGGRFAAAPILVQIFEMQVATLLGFLHDSVDSHILPQHIFGHPFCNLKGWLGII